jgi:AcrR family transcriptional regulator
MPRNKQQNEQVKAENRKKILATAQQLFSKHGYDGCNISDIARQAEMSQGNIYWYFASKEEIYQAVLIEGFKALGSVMAEAATLSGTATEKLDYFLKSFGSLMKEQGGDEFVNIVVSLIAQGGVERFAKFGLSTYEIGAGYHQSLNAIFAQGQAEGVFSQDLDPNLLSTFFFSFINGLMLMYPDEWKDIPDEVIRAAILRLLGSKAG